MVANLVLKNGKIYTMDGNVNEAVSIKDDTIIKVGTNKEVEKFITDETEVIDLMGKAVIPGFIDTHTHLVGYGCSINAVNLENTTSKEEVVERCRDFINKNDKTYSCI